MGNCEKMQCLTCWLHSKLFIFFWNPRVRISKKLVSFGVADFDEMDSFENIGGEEKQWDHKASFSHVFHTILKMTKTNMHLKIPTGRKKAERMKGEQKERKKGGQSWHTLTPDRSPPGGTYWQHAMEPVRCIALMWTSDFCCISWFERVRDSWRKILRPAREG